MMDQSTKHNLPFSDSLNEIPSKSPRHLSLACQALGIVLQQWMLSNLGWTTSFFEQRLIQLREEIVVDRCSNIATELQPSCTKNLLHHLELECGYFDEDFYHSVLVALEHVSTAAIVVKVNVVYFTFSYCTC